MGMSTGNANTGLNNEPNVTPMIDVLLVLLIIFMMVVPMSRKAIDTQLPDPNPAQVPANANPDQIVLSVLPQDKFQINKEDVTKERLAARLKEIYDGRPEKIIFVKGDTTIQFQNVIFAMDVARGAGVKIIGVPPKDQ
jgi:biopolymer transport protein TolR